MNNESTDDKNDLRTNSFEYTSSHHYNKETLLYKEKNR